MTAITRQSKHKNRIREGSKAVDVVMYLIAAFVILITVYPMYYVLIISLSAPEVAITMKVYTHPIGFNINAYKVLLKNADYWRSYLNTLLYLAPNTILPIVLATMVAYPMSYNHLIGRKILTYFLIIPMYIGGGLIPTFLLIRRLGLYNTPWVMVCPLGVSISSIILIHSAFRRVPNELREAATIDGANIYQVLIHVYLPASVAIFAVMAIRALVGTWNDWYKAYIYLPKRDWQPLQLYLRRLLTLESTFTEELSEQEAKELEDYKLAIAQLKYAMIIISTLPILCVYPYFQRFFIKGVMLGSLKG